MKLRTIFQAGAQAVLNQVRLFAKKEGQLFTALKNGLAKIMSGRKFWGMWADPSSPTPVSLSFFNTNELFWRQFAQSRPIFEQDWTSTRCLHTIIIKRPWLRDMPHLVCTPANLPRISWFNSCYHCLLRPSHVDFNHVNRNERTFQCPKAWYYVASALALFGRGRERVCTLSLLLIYSGCCRAHWSSIWSFVTTIFLCLYFIPFCYKMLISIVSRLGLAISDEAIEQMKAHLVVTDDDLEIARKEEAKRRHDVMGHVQYVVLLHAVCRMFWGGSGGDI